MAAISSKSVKAVLGVRDSGFGHFALRNLDFGFKHPSLLLPASAFLHSPTACLLTLGFAFPTHFSLLADCQMSSPFSPVCAKPGHRTGTPYCLRSGWLLCLGWHTLRHLGRQRSAIEPTAEPFHLSLHCRKQSRANLLGDLCRCRYRYVAELAGESIRHEATGKRF